MAAVDVKDISKVAHSEATTMNVTTDSPSLSKNARKKAARAERLAAYKIERRAREKEAKKEKKRIRAEKRAAGEADSDIDERTSKKQKLQQCPPFGGRVVVDLGFDNMMSEKVVFPCCDFPPLLMNKAGNHILGIPIGVYIQHESKCGLSIFFDLYVSQWPNV